MPPVPIGRSFDLFRELEKFPMGSSRLYQTILITLGESPNRYEGLDFCTCVGLRANLCRRTELCAEMLRVAVARHRPLDGYEGLLAHKI